MEIGYRERVFHCHETAEGHFQAVPERVAEGLQVCAGFAAHRANGFKRLLDIQQPLSEIDFTKHRAELERHGVKFPQDWKAA